VIRATWTVLFSPRGPVRRARARTAYRRLPIPSWAKEYLDPFDKHADLGALMDAGLSKRCSDMTSHLAGTTRAGGAWWMRQRDTVSAVQYERYAKKLKALREYVDGRKRKGFWSSLEREHGREVFWVILVGAVVAALGLLLAVLILMAQIVQAWAEVKIMKGLGIGS